ncbi:MAG: hypothetical protein QNK04_17410 [Myxococcota bacterium]|nr:hypothetical protein [Myxococcota bacterium]
MHEGQDVRRVGLETREHRRLSEPRDLGRQEEQVSGGIPPAEPIVERGPLRQDEKGGRGRQQRVEPGEGVGETLRSPAGVGTLGDDAVGALPHREVAPPVRLVRLPEEEEHAGRDGAGDEAAGHLAAPRA